MLSRSMAAFKIVDLESSPASAELVDVEVLSRDDKAEKDITSAEVRDENRPSPVQFDEFIMWACRQWSLEYIKISRQIKEEYVPYSKRKYPSKVKQRTKIHLSGSFSIVDTGSATMEPKPSTSTIKSNLATKASIPTKSIITMKPPIPQTKSVSKVKSAIANTKSGLPSESAKGKSVPEDKQLEEPSIPLTTIYNTRGELVELSIINCQEKISQKFIKLINVALPFHKYLNKITIRKGGLSQGTIYEIYKMLPYSNITEVCFDDNYVRQGNYYILLEELTSLKVLSLCRCSINEIVCEDIVRRLEPGCPGDKLLSLSLSTNFIGDIGARKFGNLLRRNRNLLHLNLADNEITNAGAGAILESLKDFKLNEKELLRKRNRKMAYEKKKIRAYEVILLDMATAAARRKPVGLISSGSTKKNKTIAISKKDNKAIKSALSQNVLHNIYELALGEAEQVVGDFHDLFDEENTMEKNNKWYCVGNVRLCYLNLAYNNLDDRILKKFRQVLTYQATLPMPSVYTGLLKLVIEGNLFSRNNVDLLITEMLLTKILPDRRPPNSATSRKLRSKRGSIGTSTTG